MISSWARDLPEYAVWGWTLEAGPVCVDLWREVEGPYHNGDLNLDLMIGHRTFSAFFGRWHVGYSYLWGKRRGHGVVRPGKWG